MQWLQMSLSLAAEKNMATCVRECTCTRAPLPMLSVKIRSPVAGVVSRPLAAGLRQCDTGRHFITSLVTAAVSDERRCSTYFFFVEVSPHYSAPPSASLSEGSRADCIQTCSPHVQVSLWVCTCLPHRRALSSGRCRGSSATPFQFIFITDCQPYPTVYHR